MSTMDIDAPFLPAFNINSPRGAGVEGEDADWDFGTGAGFYVDAKHSKYAKHYRMYSYITEVRRSVGWSLIDLT